MTDALSPDRRSANMRAIRSKGMKPELIVRKAVHALGHRYRLHRPDIPGKPDLAFIGQRKVIFVNGCFWHQHRDCREGRLPKSNPAYWTPKLARNVARDAENLSHLKAAGWDALTLWECEISNANQLTAALKAFLS